jgi:uncharacterized protein
MMTAINYTRDTILCARLEEASTISAQAVGLLGRDTLAPDHGLLFVRNRFDPFMWMHTLFMRFAIDIVFLDRGDNVIRIVPELQPWRFSPIVWAARKALELPAGAAARSATRAGDQIRFLTLS